MHGTLGPERTVWDDRNSPDFLARFSKNEAILSKIIYIRWSISYMLYNRKCFCFVHGLRNKKGD